MINPLNPEGVRLHVNIPEKLGKETAISSFDVKDRQTPFIL